jgi:hypothetical protein
MCGTAFVAVFTLLVALAIIIRFITVALPGRGPSDDSTIIAVAIGSVVSAIYPGARVTRIEEET